MGGSPTPPHLEPPEIASRWPEVRKRKERGRRVREEGEFSGEREGAKEATTASSSIVAVNGGRRKWRGRRAREIEEEGEGRWRREGRF